MKIAILIRRYITVGGAERYAVEVARRLAEKHEVHIFAQEYGSSLCHWRTLVSAVPSGRIWLGTMFRHVVPGQSISINPVACACDPCGGNGVFGFWLRFGLVTGRCGHAPGPKPRQKDQKSPLGIALK